ncbi:conserved protein of unknown function [Rhodovastum atsumiense]|uniref:Uncharacterized protein n=1 Tax=Rhodovastum atsumiense TaxID=504468 RepID=A0A5M6INX6_9PROT|nr:hypothetical protein [Rhodovastum atsumiense]KAA5609960.1 hypothetical protein F1189_21420 [Rhodovastum atsumiense]CAH2598599.1 conserved protein of unknown function [Rhodovastum atsumiense]
MGRHHLTDEQIDALYERIRVLEAALEPFAAIGREPSLLEMEEAAQKAAELLPRTGRDSSGPDDYFLEQGRQQDA